MKVVFHEDFDEVCTMDPAAEPGRMEAVIDVIQPHVEFVNAEPAAEKDLLAVHTQSHVENVKREMDRCQVDLIAISAGFDNHERDWGGTLTTEDYREIGRMVLKAAKRSRGGVLRHSGGRVQPQCPRPQCDGLDGKPVRKIVFDRITG